MHNGLLYTEVIQFVLDMLVRERAITTFTSDWKPLFDFLLKKWTCDLRFDH